MRMMLVPSLTNTLLVAKVGEDLSSLIIKHIDMQEHAEKKAERYVGLIFTLPPMPSTRILDPITDVEIKSEGLNNFQKIASYLSQMKLTDSGKSFESFLTELGIDEESYIYALRATLTTSKVFLKRNLEETRINNYNSILLESWEANMDIQYILDPYACIHTLYLTFPKVREGFQICCMRHAKKLKQKIVI